MKQSTVYRISMTTIFFFNCFYNCWIFLLIFFCVDMAVSGLALVRSNERERGIPADSAWQQVMDEHYGDEVLKKIYPNALKAENPSGIRSGTRTE